jgi:hypothetical protein
MKPAAMRPAVRDWMPLFVLCSLLAASPESAVADARFFVQSAPAFTWTSLAPKASASDIDWTDYARYYAMPTVLDMGLELIAGPTRLVFRVDIRPDFLSFATNSYRTNLPFAAYGVDSIGDVNMPTVGFLAHDGDRLKLSIGRRQLKWGPGSYGLAISDNAPYLDHLRAEYIFPAKRGDWWYEFAAIGADRAGEVWISGGNVGPYKNIFAHRVGWESESLRIAVGELNLIHDIVPGLIDISPFAVYHNMYQDAYSNVMLEASAEARLGMARVYGEFVLDDLVMPWEVATARPTAMGFLAGGEWRLREGSAWGFGAMGEGDYGLGDRSFGSRGGLFLRFEFYRTTAYLYNREIDSGKWTIPDHRLVSADPFYLNEANAFCLGFPWGPDTRLGVLRLEWEELRLKAALSLSFLQKGANTIDSAYSTSGGAADWFILHDPVVSNLIVGLSGECSLGRGLGLWGRSEFWLGDTPKANLGAGLSIRYAGP